LNSLDDSIEIVRHIRAGGYFDAYQGRDRALERPVFLKIARAPADPVGVAIVAAHIHTWQAFSRTHVDGMPAILNIGLWDNRPALVTEWIGSTPLRARVSAEPRIIADAGDFLSRLLGRCLFILGDLHAQGLVHTDISPGNVLVGTRTNWLTVYLVDPAPVLDLPDPDDPTHKLILGTAPFLAPEVLAGHPATPAADLFALGQVIADAARALGIRPPRLVQDLTASRPEDRPSSASAALAGLSSVDPAEANDDTMAVPAVPDDDWRKAPTVINSVPRMTSDDARSIVSAAMSVPLAMPPHEPPPPPPPVADPADEKTLAYPVPASPLAAKPSAMLADFSIAAPNLIEAGRHFVLEVWTAPSEQRQAMLEQATRSGRMIEHGNRSGINVDRDTLITVILKLPDFDVPDPVETLGWNGDIRNVGFIVKAPAALAPGIYPGTVKLMQGQIPFASIVFDLEVVSAEGRGETPRKPLEARLQRIARAFASYASLDRAEVLRRVQGIQAVGTNVFLDIINLRTGHEWEHALYQEIDASDGFFLFWSRNAAQSEWVEREWRYALKRRGLDFINPLPLEDPRVVKPPAELSSKHFNDMLLAFIKAEETYKSS
jgi:serine/threonine protein kinase